MWEHPQDSAILSSIQSSVSPQLSFLCLHTTPRTNPDNSRLTVQHIQFSVFRHSKTPL